MSGAKRRLAVGLEYDGARFAGWQLQPGLATIQDHVQRALACIADHPVEATCAGRTDAAVHACGQVAHFDTTSERPMRGWVLGTNGELPAEIAMLWAVEVDPEFHARHAALARNYRYCILQRATRSHRKQAGQEVERGHHFHVSVVERAVVANDLFIRLKRLGIAVEAGRMRHAGLPRQRKGDGTGDQ